MSKSFEIEGKIHIISPVNNTNAAYPSRRFIVETSSGPDDVYPQHPEFNASKARCADLDRFRVGESVRITFNINGRPWTNPAGKIITFNTLEAWKIESMGSANTNGGEHYPQVGANASPSANTQAEESQDLPF